MSRVAERKQLDDRQLDAILERLDRIVAELHVMNARLETADGLQRLAHELKTLNESLQALAYASLGSQAGPHVRRRSA
jgi:archaellum component FlaC